MGLAVLNGPRSPTVLSQPPNCRVLMLVNNDLSYDSRVRRSASLIADNGHKVTLIAFGGSTSSQELATDNLEVHRVRSTPHFRRLGGLLKQAGTSKGARRKLAIAARILREFVFFSRQAGPKGILTSALVGTFLSRELVRGMLAGKSLIPLLQMIEYSAFLARHCRVREYSHVYVHDARLLPVVRVLTSFGRKLGMGSASLVYDVHELVEGQEHVYGDGTALLSSVEVRCMAGVSHFVYVSAALAETHSESRPVGVPWEVVHNYPSRTAIESLENFPQSGSVKAGTEAVYSGLLSPLRGLETVLNAMPVLDLDLRVIYAPHQRDYFEKLEFLAKSLGVERRISGQPFVQPEDLLVELSGSCFGVLPLLRNDPKSGGLIKNHQVALTNKLFEYVAAGLPVVVSDCAAQARFVLENGIGVVFESGSPSSFRDAVRVLLANLSKFNEAVQETRPAIEWELQRDRLLAPFS